MDRRTINRREAIKQTLAWCIGAAVGGNLLSACGPGDPPPPCEPGYDDPAIGWGPNVLAPVFYGYADYNAKVGAPANLRVYYPSLDGSPECAPFLTGPGHFPLVIFLHGDCSDDAEYHYTKWSRLPAVLARSGFIVAIPGLNPMGPPWILESDTYSLVGKVIDWMRTTWSHSKYVMGPSTLGIVGHSWGAMYGGQLALTIPATAFVSLGGAWTDWPNNSPNPLPKLTIPKLLARGTGTALEGLNFNAVPSPKHRLVFTNGQHLDYVPAQVTLCKAADNSAVGPCDLVADLVADFTAVFLSKYMGPEETHGALSSAIPDNLVLPAVKLTQKQMFFAGNHLASFGSVGAHKGCSVTLDWVTSGGSGARTLP